MATYEFWLTDDMGRRLCLLQDISYFSYSRSLLGYGTILVGLPYDSLKKQIFPVFSPDRRIDVWRSPAAGTPMRRECVYLLRSYKIYTRKTDNMRMISFTGHDPTDLLARRFVIQAAGLAHTRMTDYADDMMKQIVREQMLWGSALDAEGVLDNSRAYPDGVFSVQADASIGPIVSAAFADRNVLDILKELRQATYQLNQDNALANRRVLFDVVPYDTNALTVYILDEVTALDILDEAGFGIIDESSFDVPSMGFQFQTFGDLRGQDRTGQLEFSVENSNLDEPYYTQSFLDEVNAVIVKGYGRGDSRVSAWVTDTERINQSHWNRRETFKDGSQEPDQTKLEDVGYPELFGGIPTQDISAVFLNVPGGSDIPRSLYGVDWDLGDLVPVNYAGIQFNAEVVIVYVAIDESGTETITGRNQVSATLG